MRRPLALIAIFLVFGVSGCKERKPRRTERPAPDPAVVAEALASEVDVLLGQGKYLAAIARINAVLDVSKDAARRPLLEKIQAAAAEEERRRAQAIGRLIDEGKLDEAQAAIARGRAELPTTFSGSRFAAEEQQLATRRARSDDDWAEEFRHLVAPKLLTAYGRDGWQQLCTAVRRYLQEPEQRGSARQQVAGLGPSPRILRAAILLAGEREAPAAPDRLTLKPANARAHWVRPTPGEGGEPEIDVLRTASNRIDIVHARGLKRVELLLSPRVFDLGKPVVVVQGDITLLKKRLRVDPGRQLELAVQYPDGDFAATLEVTPVDRPWTERYAALLDAPALRAIGRFGREAFERLLVDLRAALDGDARALARLERAPPAAAALDAALAIAERATPLGAGEHEVVTRVPTPLHYHVRVQIRKGDERPRLPLFVDMAGEGGVAPYIARHLEFRTIGDSISFVGVIAVADPRIGWRPGDGIRQIHAVIRHVCRRAPVDRSRVYLAGYEAGATGAWMAALTDPSPLTVVSPSAGRLAPRQMGLLPTLEHVGIYAVHYGNASDKGLASVRDAVTALRRIRHPWLVFQEYPTPGGETERDRQRKLAWVLERRRVVAPRRIVARCHAPVRLRRYHLIISGYEAGRATRELRLGGQTQKWFEAPAGLTLSYEGDNSFTVADVDGVTELTLLLTPRLVDLDRPLTVKRGDEVLFSGKVRRSIAERLRLARRYPDANYHAELVVRLR